MIRFDQSELLQLAAAIPHHNLREVRELPGFNTWGVDFLPQERPSILWVGADSGDFNPKCWPFMAAHEALHSIATSYAELDDYQFLLYNILEDWRINQCLLGVFGKQLQKSYDELRLAILRRWQREPLKLRSPVSQALQHVCYLNHLSHTAAPTLPQAGAFLTEIMWLRNEFADCNNWPVIWYTTAKTHAGRTEEAWTPEHLLKRDDCNRRTSDKLLEMLKRRRKPKEISVDEIRLLIARMGYDLSFKPSTEIESAEVPKVEIRDVPSVMVPRHLETVMPQGEVKGPDSKGMEHQISE
jgi:hypothetical protein